MDPLENGGAKPETIYDDVWLKMKIKTMAQIRQWIDHSVFHHVAQEQSAYALWTKLENMYRAKMACNKSL